MPLFLLQSRSDDLFVLAVRHGLLNSSDVSVVVQPCGLWPVTSVWSRLPSPPSFATSAVLSSVRCLRGAPGGPVPTRTARTSPPRKVRSAERDWHTNRRAIFILKTYQFPFENPTSICGNVQFGRVQVVLKLATLKYH